MSSLDLGLKEMAEISTSPNCICDLMVWRMSEKTGCQWKSSKIKLGHRLLFSRADGFSDKHYLRDNGTEFILGILCITVFYIVVQFQKPY